MNWENGQPQYGVAIGTPDIVEAISCGCFTTMDKAEAEARALINDFEDYGWRKPQKAFIFECKMVMMITNEPDDAT